MPGTVNFGGFHQVIGQAHIELAQHEHGAGSKPVGQNNGPTGVVQPQLLEEHEPWDQRHFGGDHHGGQEDHEDNVPALEVDLRESVGSQRGKEQLEYDGKEGDIDTVQVAPGHGHFTVEPDFLVVVPPGYFGQPVEILLEHFRRSFQGGGDHPQQRQQERHADGHEDQGLKNFHEFFVSAITGFHVVPPPLLIVDPLLLTNKVDARDHHDNGEQHHRHGRSRTELILGEGSGVNFQNHGAVGIDGRTHGEHVDGAEDLENGHGTGDEQIENGGGDHGQGDAPELPEAACAVQLGSLVQAHRHVLHGGGKQNQLIADGSPYRQQNDGHLGEPGVHGPLDGLG